MAHIRAQLRHYLKTALQGSALAADRVLLRRSLPLEQALRPTLIVTAQSERSQDMSMGGAQDRSVDIRIAACIKGEADETEDQLDELAVHIESVLAADPTLGGLAQAYEYRSTEFSTTTDGERSFCVAALTFAVTYYAARGNPQLPL